MFLNNPQTKAPSQCLNKFHHDLLLNFSEESLFEGTDRTFSNVYVDLPVPINQPSKIYELKDEVVSLIEKKRKYLDFFENQRRQYKHDIKNIRKNKMKSCKFVNIPRQLLELYKKKDPDPYFHCDYNYYYTGGILEALEIDGKTYLTHVTNENTILLLDVQNTNNSLNIGFKTNSPIYNIYTLNNRHENDMVVREKHAVHLVGIDQDKVASSKWTFNGKFPIFDAKINDMQPCHIGLAEANGFLSVRDIESNKRIFHYKGIKDKQNYDNFQQFKFFDTNLICLMNNYKIKTLDYRTETLGCDFEPQVINCNSLCNIMIHNNTLLLASRHYIIKSDLRFLKNISTYSHTLSSPPCYMDICEMDGDFYLAVAGQQHNNKVLFTGNTPFSLPYEVPSVLKTFDETIIRNPTMILLSEELKNRLKLSLTGLKILNLDRNVAIFTCNSIGDVFKQNVCIETITNDHKDISEWLKNIEISNESITVNIVEDLSEVRSVLNRMPHKKQLKKGKTENKSVEFLSNFKSRYKKNNIKSDWTHQFLSIWLDSDESDEEMSNPFNHLPEVPVADKVEEWMQEHNL